jgi:D-3-phosphoglycerate dehydrogenase / 2-oxoglutarate reductase
MPRVLISGQIDEAGMAVLRARPGLVIEEMANSRPEDFLARLPEADALLLRIAFLPGEAIVNANRLKVVSRYGVGYDNVPLDALTAKGVAVTVVGPVHTDTVAEHAFFLILALAKAGLRQDAAMRTGGWNIRTTPQAVDLAGKSLFIIGFGRIGRSLARRASAFDMQIIAHDPNVSAAEMAAVGVAKADDWRQALAQADFVSLHAPRLPDTERMIGAAELRSMKPTAFIVNTARGGLIDEAALAAALAAGTIAGAGIDVFEEEPPPRDHRLFASDRVILSPHVAGLTREANVRIAVTAAKNILAGLDGRLDPELVVNKSVLAR